MRILVIGGSGMLGHKIVQEWRDRFDVWTTLKGRFEDYENFGIFEKSRTFDQTDVERFETIEKIIETVDPEVIFNAVGLIKQLPSSKNVIKTLSINSIFPHRLAEIVEKTGAKLINISTDCVFDGEKGNYTEEDISNATDIYGKSKNLGEVTGGNCLTLRTSIIGRELKTSHSLVEWFLSNRGKKVNGFVNAIYTGFPTIVLAGIIADLIDNHRNLSGLYHVSSEPINKFDLLKLINEAYGANVDIEPDEDFHIDRSLNSSKFREETGFTPASWQEMIKSMVDDRTPYDDWRK